MATKTKKLSYKGCKNVLNRVAYKLIKSGKTYKHSASITINGKKKSHDDIVKTIKNNGTKYTNNEYISRFMEDIIAKTNKEQLPGYIIGASGKTKYNRASYRKIATTLTEYRKKNNKNPSEITVSYEPYTPPIKLNNYLTSEGCSGMGQCTGYYCACNSLQQSFHRLTGILVAEKTIAGWAGTTSDGTDHEGINTAVAMFNKKYNKNVKIKWYNFSELNWDKISNFIKNGAVFFHLLYRNKWGHYEPIKSVGDTLKILNSLGDSCGNGTYCGYIESRTKSEQKSYINGISQKSVAILTNG